MGANLTLTILNAADTITEAYWLPITATIVAGLLIGLLILCGVYLKSRPYTKYTPDTRAIIWLYGWIGACFLISLFMIEFLHNQPVSWEPTKRGLFLASMSIIIYLCGIIAFLGPSIISECINWMKERGLRYLVLNLSNIFSNRWFDWLKWATIIAAISYIQVQTSDEILKVIVAISYLALFSNIAMLLLPIFVNLFNRTPIALITCLNILLRIPIFSRGEVPLYPEEEVSRDVHILYATFILVLSFLIVSVTYLIIDYTINKIQEARIMICG